MAALFLALAAGWLAVGWAVAGAWGAVACATLAAPFVVVAAAYAGVGARPFGKRADGSLARASWIALAPFHALNALSLAFERRRTRARAWDEVAARVRLGRMPTATQADQHVADGVVAVVDLTAEFATPRALRRGCACRCVPVLDTRAPSTAQFDEVVAFIERERARGIVLVVCAAGHGRSATAVAAWLLATGAARTVDEAEAALRARRPRVALNRAQRRALAAWAQARRPGDGRPATA